MHLLRIFYAPEEVFAELPHKDGAWLLPFVGVILLAVLSTVVIVNMIGLETIVKTQLESNPRIVEQMGQQKIDEAARQAADSTLRKALTYAAPVIGSACMLGTIALVLLGAMHLAGAPAPLSRILAVCSYAQFAYHAVALVMSVIILSMVTDRSGLDINSLVRLNPTLFLDKASTPKFEYSFLSSLDLLSFWAIFLTALGLTKSASKLRLRKSLSIVIACWIVYVWIKSAVAMLF